ncbi:hypothetical protein E1176_08870, partial [Fulvivirga sp. RKSG066]|uniref:hypothetical protein n=1 Tax=Fulvivirga aurantia TaxID=2529383 RepID=UPI0012BC3F79
MSKKRKELDKFIKTYTIDRGNRLEEKEALEEDLKWGVSLFLAKAIHLAKPRDQTYSLDQFNQFKSQYEQDNGKQINTESLFQKFWLRNVLSTIKVAGTVSSACNTFQKIHKYQNELTFLYSSIPDGAKKNSKLTKHDFELIRKEYEKKNNLTLSDVGLFESNWLSASEDTVEISNINFYFKPYLDYWKEFEFLCAYQNQIAHKDDKGLQIEKKVLDQLHQSFSSFYQQTPPIQKLIDEKVLTPDGRFYYLNFYHTKIRYWSGLSDQITAYYWQLLIEDSDFVSDRERLRRFINQTHYYGWASSSLYCSIEESKKRFLQAAFELVKNETDLSGIDTEFKKVSIDQRLSSSDIQLLFHSREERDDFSLDGSDHFELLKGLDRWEEKAHTTYLYDQSCRKELSYLIRVIVKNDLETEKEETEDEDHPNYYHFKRVFELLHDSVNKPTLLWKIVQGIISCRREILPYLIVEKTFTSLSFWIVDQIISNDHLPIEERPLLAKKLWSNCTELALHVAREHVKNGEAAKIIFQVYRQLNHSKYDIPYSRQSRKATQSSREQKEEKEKAVLSLIENSPLFNHTIHGASQQYLIPNVFNKLVDLFVNFETRSLYSIGTIQFPMLQWDGLAWLMKCSTYWKYKGQLETNTPNVQTLTNSFFKLYIDRIEVTEVKKYNF